MYRELRNTLEENVFNQLDGERKRMALQFYLFGFCYVCSGVSYAIESWFWSTYTSTHDESNLFIIYVITACLITVGDGLPILYISCVHNSTFRDIQLTKQVYQKQAASCDEEQPQDKANATYLGESNFDMLEDTDAKISPKGYGTSNEDSKTQSSNENEQTIQIHA